MARRWSRRWDETPEGKLERLRISQEAELHRKAKLAGFTVHLGYSPYYDGRPEMTFCDKKVYSHFQERTPWGELYSLDPNDCNCPDCLVFLDALMADGQASVEEVDHSIREVESIRQSPRRLAIRVLFKEDEEARAKMWERCAPLFQSVHWQTRFGHETGFHYGWKGRYEPDGYEPFEPIRMMDFYEYTQYRIERDEDERNQVFDNAHAEIGYEGNMQYATTQAEVDEIVDSLNQEAQNPEAP